MEITIGGTCYDYRTDYQDDKTLRGSFEALAGETFGLSLEPWYLSGNWTDRYRPYSLLHKRQGLCRFLLARVLTDWSAKCDGIYLYANAETTQFFPQFGFSPLREWRHSMNLSGDGKRRGVRRLIAGITEDRLLLLKKYAQSNPFSLLTSEHNAGLLLFHCFGKMRTCIYYIESYDAVAIAESIEDTLYCHEIYGGAGAPLRDILTALAGPETRKAILGFTPKEGAVCSARPLREKDSPLLFLDGKDIFGGRQLRLPLLSRT